MSDETPPAGAPAPTPTPKEQAALGAEFARRFPHVLQIAPAATRGDLAGVGHGCDEDFEFTFALDLLLDGAARLHRAGWVSVGRPTGDGQDVPDTGSAG